MTPADGRREGDRRKYRGMNGAATGKEFQIFAHESAFLRAILASADSTATTDDVGDIGEKFADGGQWRGSITKRLSHMHIIAPDGVVKSVRPSRHRGYITRWRLVDRDKAETQLQFLSQLLAAMQGGDR